MAEKETKAKLELNIGQSGRSKGLGSFFELLSKIHEMEKEEYHRSEEISGLGDKVKVNYDFSIKTGIGGQPAVKQPGSIKKTARSPVKVTEVREPIVDIFDEGDYLMLITELPGIEESDIHLEIKGDILDLKAEREDSKYRKKILLPVNVEAESMKTQCKNGTIKIKLAKKASSTEGDK